MNSYTTFSRATAERIVPHMEDEGASKRKPSASRRMTARLRAALSDLGISQAEAARRFGMSQPNFDRLVNNKTRLMPEHLFKIEENLGIPLAYLLGETDDLPGTKRTPS